MTISELMTYNEAVSNAEGFYWNLMDDALKYIDKLEDTKRIEPQKLLSILLSSFKVTDLGYGARVCRVRKHVDSDGKKRETHIDLLEAAGAYGLTGADRLDFAMRYVRRRLTLATLQQYRLKSYKSARSSARLDTQGSAPNPMDDDRPVLLASGTDNPADVAEFNELHDKLKSTLSQQDYELLLEIHGKGTSQRSIAKLSQSSRYRVAANHRAALNAARAAFHT